ncbi:hypothetical protein DPMN_080317 [Dreissena polymorpha]|uniref:Uncharacterized protein n=1 Tax=Dreissena polymorpha TaxID=45954 RepID=A0A9D3YUV4_DREPO|nr:hypothetical protein DPMN_080317 [Dreissena polymorpha]
MTGHSAKRTQSNTQTETADHHDRHETIAETESSTRQAARCLLGLPPREPSVPQTPDTSPPHVRRQVKYQKVNSHTNAARTVLLEDDDKGPKHSTPVLASRQQRRSQEEKLECTLTEQYLERMQECEGKSIIMDKFMADQTLGCRK